MEMCLVIVANAFALGAYIVIFRIFLDLSDSKTARCALVLLVAWPAASLAAWQAASRVV